MSNPTALNNQRGQSSLEAAIMALMLVIFVVAFLGSLYLMYSSYWVEHVMYESLICYQEKMQMQACVNEAKRKIGSILFFRQGFDFKIEDRGSVTKARLKMMIDPPWFDAYVFKFVKELRI